MTDSGRLGPEPPDEGFDEQDYVNLINSALLELGRPDAAARRSARHGAERPGATRAPDWRCRLCLNRRSLLPPGIAQAR